MREENLLLANLPDAERRKLDPYLREDVLEFQQVLIEPNQPITTMYFPYDAITSTIQEMSDGDSVETGLMGIEGFVGVQLWLHAPTTPTRTLVQVPGKSACDEGHRFPAAPPRHRLTFECPLREIRARVSRDDLADCRV
jgi:hypothetical protein